MTREHDIEDIVRRLLDHHARINAGLSFDETPPATSVYSEAAAALSSLAAENGWLRGALEDTAWRAKQDTEDEWRSVLEDRLKTIAENARAALSSPAPEGMAGGDEVVP